MARIWIAHLIYGAYLTGCAYLNPLLYTYISPFSRPFLSFFNLAFSVIGPYLTSVCTQSLFEGFLRLLARSNRCSYWPKNIFQAYIGEFGEFGCIFGLGLVHFSMIMFERNHLFKQLSCFICFGYVQYNKGLQSCNLVFYEGGGILIRFLAHFVDFKI